MKCFVRKAASTGEHRKYGYRMGGREMDDGYLSLLE